MHQAVRQRRRPQVERAVARKVQPAEVRQCLASRRRPVVPAGTAGSGSEDGAGAAWLGSAGGRFGPSRVSSEKQ